MFRSCSNNWQISRSRQCVQCVWIGRSAECPRSLGPFQIVTFYIKWVNGLIVAIFLFLALPLSFLFLYSLSLNPPSFIYLLFALGQFFLKEELLLRNLIFLSFSPSYFFFSEITFLLLFLPPPSSFRR